jgi:ubiquinone/menaquinone biosynthesis C-methylase UbiE
MRNDLLEFYANMNAAFLHAFSEKGTEVFLKKLTPVADERVLEIGFGTGATLVKIKSRYPSVQLYGVERSQLMINKANARLKFCGLKKNVSLYYSGCGSRFLFEDDAFDTVFSESVLAIQDQENLEHMLSEIYRILRPGGRLIMNETVWLPSISKKEISSINKRSLLDYGIIQSVEAYPTSRHWISLLNEVGFLKIQSETIQPMQTTIPPNRKELLSKLFTLSGKLRSLVPSRLKQKYIYKKRMTSAFPEDKQYLEAVIFSAIK